MKITSDIESNILENALFYIGVSFSLILIFEVVIFYILETFFQYPSYLEQYGFWIGVEAFLLALLTTIVLSYKNIRDTYS